MRHAAWTLLTCHVGSNDKTTHQRIRGKVLYQQDAAIEEHIFFIANWFGWTDVGLVSTRGWDNLSRANNAAVVMRRSFEKRNKDECWVCSKIVGVWKMDA